ncbi:MAG: hypothetical protein ACF8Q5_14235 [Phycisphaerales bacterium JB040]
MPRLALLLAPLVLLASCAARPDAGPVPVEARSYADAFDAVRDELRWMGFELERIDANAGVIETRPKPTAGLATPWDTEQSTIGQEWDDFVNDHRRVVRVTFHPGEGDPGQADPGEAPDREMAVEVTVYRLRAPGSRLETESVSLNSVSVDELAEDRGLAGRYLTPIGRDTRLESRLTQRLRSKITGDAS